MTIELSDLIQNADQRQILESVESFLSDRLPLERLRGQDDTRNPEHDAWMDLAELGLFGLAVPEEAGGVDCTVVEESLLFKLAGAYLLGPSVLATVLAARAAAQTGDIDLAERLIAGRARCAMAIRFGKGETDCLVFDPEGAQFAILVSAEETLLFDMSQVRSKRRRRGLDETTALSEASFPSEPWFRLDHKDLDLHRELVLLAAAYMAGIAEAASAMAVSHAKTREQFGKPIGTFQAIKHHCANMATQANAAASLTLFAAITVRNGEPDSDFQVSAAQLIASRAAAFCAATNIQVHGAMGFTAECLAHFCMKRSHLMDRLSGGGPLHASHLLEIQSPLTTT